MKRIPQLDGVRGLAIILVLFWHYGGCTFDGPRGSFPWLGNILLRMTWSGVDLFFVLSGFLIAGILLDHRDTANYFRVFYLRRACRIVPLYFCVALTFIAVSHTALADLPRFAWLFHNPMPDWSYATFTQNILMALRGTLGANAVDATWSLAVEEQFYLFIPLLIYFLPRRALIGTLVAAIVAAPILRWASSPVVAFVGTPWRSDSLLSGALLAVLVRSHGFVVAAQSRRRSLSWSLIVLVGGLAVLTIHPPLLQGGALTHLWLAALCVCVLLMAFLDTEPMITAALRTPVMVWFGQLSYGIYLLHKPALGAVFGIFRGTDPVVHNFNDLGLALLALAITLLVAALSFRFLESPIIRFGHRTLYRPRASPTND